MNRHPHPLRHTLVATVLDEAGTLELQRRFFKARMELPHENAAGVLAKLVDPSKRVKRAQADVLAKVGIQVTTLLDEDYPRMLKHIGDPPLVLFYRGALQCLHRPAISIVGSRSCTHYGQQVTRKIAGELARLGFVIVSGLALGIDGLAHAACLEVGGRTVAVLGSGLDRIYPRDHGALAEDILAGEGALVSEFPPGTPPKAFHFPIRNRLISGLCHATIVVEAKAKSGSLITARHCLDQGRELFAVPGPIHHATSMGVNKLIQDGEAHLLLSVASALEQLQPLLGLAAAHEREVSDRIRDPVAKKIYDKLDAFEPMPLDILVADLALDPGTVVAKLVELETDHLVERKPGPFYVRNPLNTIT